MSHVFKHPKYYKELRKRALDERNRDPHVRPISGSVDSATDQTISLTLADGCNGSVRSGPGLKPQAASVKLQASSPKLLKIQATSIKPQATSVKLKSTSYKLPDPGPPKKFQAPWTEVLNADKCIVRMAYVKGYLVWWKPNLITLCYF